MCLGRTKRNEGNQRSDRNGDCPQRVCSSLVKALRGQVRRVGQQISLDVANLIQDGGRSYQLLASLGRRWDMTLKEEVFKIRDKKKENILSWVSHVCKVCKVMFLMHI